MDWICKIWTGFVKHGFVKHGFVKHGFLKRGFVERKWNCYTVDLFTFCLSHFNFTQMSLDV